MGIITRYMLRKILFFSIYLVIVFSSMIWLVQTVRYFKILLNHHTPFLNFFKLTILLVPSILTYVIPFAFCFGCAYVYRQFDDTNELSILPMLGFHKISKPIIYTGIIFTGLQAFMQFLVPLSFSEFLSQEYSIKNQLTFKILKPRQFNHHKGYMVYFDNFKKNTINEVFISHKKRDSNIFITAKKAQLTLDPHKGYVVTLTKGMRVDESPEQTFSLSFDNLKYEMGDWIPSLSQNPTLGMKVKELLKKDTFEARQELILRLIKILLPLISILILTLFLTFSRSDKRFVNAAVSSSFINAFFIIISKWITYLF